MAGRPSTTGRSAKAGKRHAVLTADSYISRDGGAPEIERAKPEFDVPAVLPASTGPRAYTSDPAEPVNPDLLDFTTADITPAPLRGRAGRPPILEVNDVLLRSLQALGRYGAPQREVAMVLGVSPNTIGKLFRDHPETHEAYVRGISLGDLEARRAIQRHANSNPIAAIYLTKVRLGFTETQKVDSLTAVQNVISSANASLKEKMRKAGITATTQTVSLGGSIPSDPAAAEFVIPDSPMIEGELAVEPLPPFGSGTRGGKRRGAGRKWTMAGAKRSALKLAKVSTRHKEPA
jgi:hypothetical protein